MSITDIKRNPIYFEKDPDKKNARWWSEMVTLLRREFKPVIDRRQAVLNLSYLEGVQGTAHIKGAFKADTAFTKNEKNFTNVSFFDRIINILTAEFLKSARSPQVEAVDASSNLQRKKDESLLSGRSMFEGIRSDLNARSGEPSYKIPMDKFEGNVGTFDELGLDDGSVEDRSFYMRIFHRLWHEADAQELLRALMKANEFEIYVERLIKDILANKICSFRVFASPHTGEIKWRYVNPLSLRAIPGKRPDYKDAMAVGTEEVVNVRQFLQFAGPEFNWDIESHRTALCSAINITNNTSYILVTKEGCFIESTDSAHPEPILAASHGQMMNFSVAISYMEFQTIDYLYQKKKDLERDVFVNFKPGEDKDKKLKKEKFLKVCPEVWKTYKTWFLSTGFDSQYLFKSGPLFHMITDGAYDEYSSYSFSIYKGSGKPAIEIAMPFIDIADKAFAKIVWAIDQSKPRVDWINIDSILKLITKLKPQTTDAQGNNISLSADSQMGAVLDMYTTKLTKLYSSSDEDGNMLGGDGRPHYTDKDSAGIDPLAEGMKTVMEWAENQIADRLGIAPVRDATSPDPRDGYKIQQEALKQSRNATYYIPFMIENVIKNSATSSLMIAQDAIENKSSIVYTYLVKLIGEDSMSSFKSLDKVPFHRYAIFVELFSADERKMEIRQDSQLAFQKGLISYKYYLIIREMDDFKKAGQLLAFYENKQQKAASQAAEIAHQRQLELDNQMTENKLKVINLEGQWALAKAAEAGKWMVGAHQTAADATIIKKQMDQDNNAQKLMENVTADLTKERGKQEIAAQQPIT